MLATLGHAGLGYKSKKKKRRKTQRIKEYIAPSNSDPKGIPRCSYGVYKDFLEPYLRLVEIDRIRTGGKACTTEFSSQKLFSPEVENSMIVALKAISSDWKSNTLFPNIDRTEVNFGIKKFSDTKLTSTDPAVAQKYEDIIGPIKKRIDGAFGKHAKYRDFNTKFRGCYYQGNLSDVLFPGRILFVLVHLFYS
jgi:hypothetical protein